MSSTKKSKKKWRGSGGSVASSSGSSVRRGKGRREGEGVVATADAIVATAPPVVNSHLCPGVGGYCSLAGHLAGPAAACAHLSRRLYSIFRRFGAARSEIKTMSNSNFRKFVRSCSMPATGMGLGRTLTAMELDRLYSESLRRFDLPRGALTYDAFADIVVHMAQLIRPHLEPLDALLELIKPMALEE